MLATKLAQALATTPTLIFLRGDVGAGKTTFAQGFIGELIDNSSVLSPTYSYMQVYPHQPPIYHFDLYRIDDEAALAELGLIDHLEDEQALRLVEWPERGLHTSPSVDIHLSIHDHHRIATISLSTTALITKKITDLVDTLPSECYAHITDAG